ncbi:aromatic acid exporter family protein [Paenibacillus validus]|uniref:Aromatic acid exporter family protein n=1 Tax=Paenibacillus validus TaxID=44253 RepID=A0A7X3CPY1_9BACL|nr:MULTISPECIES: aromatic acid exporter family protein [Paenibacillus]MED4602333.1 aromatic acid exporter family protein [Paenibacillus validus]MED4607634.1 aromatic acid exporter family protein [Paenibacillus validus]MUG69070.1 aromatic acid exporter family protein [Paenibacillus validus]
MTIGFRTIKTAVGVSIAILIAQSLHLSSYTSAGILALLCIQKTRKQSFTAVWERLLACLAGMAMSGFMFHFFGRHPLIFILLYMLFIPVCVRFKIQGGIASSSVIIMHIYMNGALNTSFVLNELAIIAIGLGVALIVNLYMPGIDKQISQYKEEIHANMSAILGQFAKYLVEGYGLWDGKELLTLAKLLDKGKNLAILEVENNMMRKDNPFLYYFEQKQRQYQILERMLTLVSMLDTTLEQGVRIGRLIDELGRDLQAGQDLASYHEKLRAIREYHKQLPLPVTRAEFENRANLFSLANELEKFIETM